MDEGNQLLFLADHQHEIIKVRKWNINKAQGGKSIDAMERRNYWDFELESPLYAVCEWYFISSDFHISTSVIRTFGFYDNFDDQCESFAFTALNSEKHATSSKREFPH